MMLQRTLTPKLHEAAQYFPIVTLTGPRQSGKTTLVKSAFKQYAYASLEDPELRSFANEDPRGFLQQYEGNLILDEIQRTPDLFSHIQVIVDSEDKPGRFVLTGSQNFLLLNSISQSLAGRSAIFHLLPFSLDELRGSEPLGLDQIGTIIPKGRKEPTTSLNQQLFTGFYPRIHDKNIPASDWLKYYYQTYLERDVREIVNVGNLDAFRRFASLCAGRSGQLVNLSSIASDCGITHTTAKRWLSVMEASFLIVLLRPHHKNFRKRLVKSPKLYFLDSGLLCYLLRIKEPDDLNLHASRGAVFETFVLSELFKRALNYGLDTDLFFWRDSSGHEVDIIIDTGRTIVPVEVKSGATIAKDFFKGLDFWNRLAQKKESSPSALIYGGNNSTTRKGINIHSWWNF
ncbi:MAG: ATP-binding protein [Desulfobacteraceae bacterium]|jgi:predicted AAA+ superfamily ATPase